MVGRIRNTWSEHPRRAWVFFGVLATFVVLAASLVSARAAGWFAASATPAAPGSVVASGSVDAPVIARVTWQSRGSGVSVYEVWQSATTTGTFERVGATSSDATSFEVRVGVPGQAYFYAVSSRDASGVESELAYAPEPAYSKWVPSAHNAFSSTTSSCLLCHSTHGATAPALARDTHAGIGGQTAACANCHDGRTDGPDVLSTGGSDSFGLASGHTLEQAPSETADLTNTCSSCHAPHLDPEKSPEMPVPAVNGVAVTSLDRSACEACHNDRNDWAGAGYPDTASPARDASGYPVAGTFPGASVYDSASNPHASIPASATADRAEGSCLNCHAAHRGQNRYDGLTLPYRPTTGTTLLTDQANGTYAASCFACHGETAAGPATATDIRRYAVGASQFAGHRIVTGGGTLPVGAALPCYDCHNPHGSARGNSSLLSDALGASLTTKGSAAEVRQACFACHASSDGQVWDSASGSYVPVDAVTSVEGLKRDGSDGSLLRLPDESAHASADGRSCYDCHGNDYSSPTGYNVHNPLVGASPGGQDCYACHTQYQTSMEDGAGAKVGAARTLSYHHVMGGYFDGGAYRDGDYAPGTTGSYNTTATSEMFCVSCHVDHDKSAGNGGANLRSSFGPGAVDATDTDFSADLPSGGVCTSCHATTIAKDVDNQASSVTSATSLATTSTPAIEATAYAGSAHDYAVPAAVGGSTFRGNCSKCHNDAGTAQADPIASGPHTSSDPSLLGALGVSAPDTTGSNACFACHSRTGAGAGAKSQAGRDYYGVATMTAASESVADAFAAGGSRHPVGGTGGASVACANCHNAHTVSAADPVADPDNTYAAAAYGTAEERSAFCLKCHDGTPPLYVSNGSAYVPRMVQIPVADELTVNKSAYASRGHWSVSGSISATETQSCGVCHDSHGSSAPDLLGVFDPVSRTNRINGTTIAANDNTVCFACHTQASDGATAPSRDASGYPMAGTWPGAAVYSGAGGIHSGATVVWPGSNTPGGQCANCHDPHGTANTYDELRSPDGTDSFTPTRFTLCFTCHASGGPSSVDVRRFYPLENGGLALQNVGTTNYGHAVRSTTGTLARGSGLPCYDCHATHGSAETTYGLQVVTQTSADTTIVVGNGSGELDLTTDDGYRAFCFTCHTTSDTGRGWDGSAYVTVSAGARVEGIDRTTWNGVTHAGLQLPASESAHRQGSTEACWTCHGKDYSGATSNNVHNPGVGD